MTHMSTMASTASLSSTMAMIKCRAALRRARLKLTIVDFCYYPPSYIGHTTLSKCCGAALQNVSLDTPFRESCTFGTSCMHDCGGCPLHTKDSTSCLANRPPPPWFLRSRLNYVWPSSNDKQPSLLWFSTVLHTHTCRQSTIFPHNVLIHAKAM